MTRRTDNNGLDDVGRLVRYAGGREQVSAQRAAAARDRVASHWQGVVASRRRARRRIMANRLAMAASLVVALGAALILWRPATGPATAPVAVIDRVLGDVLVDGAPVAAGDAIVANAAIETRVGGRLALTLPSGQSLRVDAETRLVASHPNLVSLESGRLYFDSHNVQAARPLVIATPFGRTTDVGTQYLVHVTSGFLTVGVREGEVRLERDHDAGVAIEDGRLYSVDRNGDEVRGDLSSTDPIWDWAAAVAPAFEIDGATLRDYLEWYAREKGLRLEWGDRLSRDYADTTRLSGSIQGLSLDDGLEVVRRIAPFAYAVREGSLVISAE